MRYALGGEIQNNVLIGCNSLSKGKETIERIDNKRKGSDSTFLKESYWVYNRFALKNKMKKRGALNMEFTYKAYGKLIDELKARGYVFSNYKNYCRYPKTVILRHDVDTNIEKAVEMAEREALVSNVNSVYFVLVTSDFYNIHSKKTERALHEIQNLGHDIGLHFDETRYPVDTDVIHNINKEIDIIENVLGNNITAVSMHRPSKKTLEKNYTFANGVINSYGEEFFKEMKYLSDSRRHWRENVEDVVFSDNYSRLHILTHPFWYYEKEKDIRSTLNDWILAASIERYDSLNTNFSNLDEIISRNTFCK